MTSVIDGARSLVTRGSDLGGRIAALESATRAAKGRLDDAVVDQAQAAVDRAAGRLRLSADHTVVGELSFTVGSSSPTTTTLERSVRTERRATTVELTGCSAGR